MSATASSLEEAAYVASEFIYSIDNLPYEVGHILNEIKHRDARTQELQNEIDKETARYIRHSLRASSQAPPGGPIPRAPSPKSALIPAKVSAAHAEIQVLAGEKQELAQRLIDVIQRTQSRLDVELNRVRVLSGEPVDMGYPPTPALTIPDMTKNPMLSVTESLKNALASSPMMDSGLRHSSAGSTSVAGGNANKRRKVASAASTPSIKVPARSASPTVQGGASQSTHQRSRLSRQIHPPVLDEDDDMDGDADEELEGDDGDDSIYCYCQKPSYGEMIACDNEGSCPYEWFHLSCTDIKGQTPDRWYCTYCTEKLAAASTAGRKGRKK